MREEVDAQTVSREVFWPGRCRWVVQEGKSIAEPSPKQSGWGTLLARQD